MLAQYLDLTEEVNLNPANQVVIDVSNYDYCLVQPIGNGATFETTIDSGAIQGVSDGSAISATNFAFAYGLRSSSTSANTLNNTISSQEIMKLNVVGRYIRITTDGSVTKLLVMLAKIS